MRSRVPVYWVLVAPLPLKKMRVSPQNSEPEWSGRRFALPWPSATVPLTSNAWKLASSASAVLGSVMLPTIREAAGARSPSRKRFQTLVSTFPPAMMLSIPFWKKLYVNTEFQCNGIIPKITESCRSATIACEFSNNQVITADDVFLGPHARRRAGRGGAVLLGGEGAGHVAEDVQALLDPRIAREGVAPLRRAVVGLAARAGRELGGALVEELHRHAGRHLVELR